MARLLYLVLIVNLNWQPASSLPEQIHENLRQSEVAKEQTPNDLVLHAEITSQTYCHVDVETFSVQMKIKLRFSNVSDHNVILSRLIESPSTIRVAKTVDEAQKGNLEYNPVTDYFPGKLPDAPRFGDRPDPKYFITLAPKESYETTVVSGVFGAVEPTRAARTKGLLPKGDHVLQLGVGTWPYQWPYFMTSDKSEELSQRWAGHGHLARSTIFSDFAGFAIPEHFKNPPCKR
jgi:hypothetical protein